MTSSRDEHSDPFVGQLAVVTGGASGIGRAVALRLLRRGARVLAVDKSAENLAKLTAECGGDRLVTQVFDLADWRSLHPLCEQLVAQHGPVRHLVNNAGVWPGAPIEKMPDETWMLNLDVNLSAPFAMIRALTPGMIRGGGGAIVTVSSRNAFRSSVNNAAYDASKAGVVALTRTAAGELARHGIRVNAVCPGVISTPSGADAQERLFKAAYTKQIPMDRYGQPDEIAAVVMFLLSDDASFITGQTIIADGGQIACQDNARFMQIPGLS